MKKVSYYIKTLLFVSLASFTLTACGGGSDDDSSDGRNDGKTNPPAAETSFVKGADISWVTEMEQSGVKFRDANGTEKECFQLMKELGMNAIRLRVWVNPTNGWNGKTDVVAKAKRAAEQGMDLMIDFHYSDSWADPGQQFKPAAWEGKSLADLKAAIKSHTVEVLQALKSADVTPKWVQVGNEIRPGMLWDEDAALSGAFYDIRACDVKDKGWTSTNVKYPKNQKNLADFVNTGYDAVKSVFPNCTVIVHIDNAWDDQTWWFDQFRAAGGKMDMIGLSHYPQTHETKTWQEMNSLALAHIKDWAAKYGVKVMVAEVGVKQSQSSSAQVLKEFVEKAKQIADCAGVFYWEPECYNWNGYDMGAFDNAGRPTSVMDAFQ